MTAKIQGIEMLKQQEINEPIDGDLSLIGLADQSESEIKWVQLHQMFDK